MTGVEFNEAEAQALRGLPAMAVTLYWMGLKPLLPEGSDVVGDDEPITYAALQRVLTVSGKWQPNGKDYVPSPDEIDGALGHLASARLVQLLPGDPLRLRLPLALQAGR